MNGIWTEETPEESGLYWVRFTAIKDSRTVAYYNGELDSVTVLNAETEDADSLTVEEFAEETGEFYSEPITFPDHG